MTGTNPNLLPPAVSAVRECLVELIKLLDEPRQECNAWADDWLRRWDQSRSDLIRALSPLGEAIPPPDFVVTVECKPTKSGFSAVITDRASMEQVIDVLDDRLRYERNNALEEAAKLCDEMTAAEMDPEYTPEDCAAEIRALKTS